MAMIRKLPIAMPNTTMNKAGNMPPARRSASSTAGLGQREGRGGEHDPCAEAHQRVLGTLTDTCEQYHRQRANRGEQPGHQACQHAGLHRIQRAQSDEEHRYRNQEPAQDNRSQQRQPPTETRILGHDSHLPSPYTHSTTERPAQGPGALCDSRLIVTARPEPRSPHDA